MSILEKKYRKGKKYKYRKLCIYIYDKSIFSLKQSKLYEELWELKANEWEEIKVKNIEDLYKKIKNKTGIKFVILNQKTMYKDNKGTIKYEIKLKLPEEIEK